MGQVIAWYTRRILAEHRRDAPDTERLEELKARRQECVREQDRLRDASVQESTRIATAYEALLEELESSEP
ncbi:hypothetical protein ACFP1Z_28670 [Streptomyces gamaensis]|uniref:Uncharacterized protein n=1 Tax=Streptomyces gamaensis TaxID=1763542 RepID=A0ABW0Z8I3_9ACTN